MAIANLNDLPKGYVVNTPFYEGPLDLLLNLIEHSKLDITSLALASVTDQYLQYLKSLDVFLVEDVSAFLIVAAKLIQIKSEALLPKPPVEGDQEEDVGEALARQLKEYKKFRKGTLFLEERESRGYRSYLRMAPIPVVQTTFTLEETKIEDLVQIAKDIFHQKQESTQITKVLSIPKITIREKIQLITSHFRTSKIIKFHDLFSDKPSSIEIVITFLALLELIKQAWILVRQEDLFGEIIIEPTIDNVISSDLELEFGE